jgi:membrane protein DedA with SNARE-associated domain
MLIYALVCGIIMLESMGLPLPGEITLVSASLLAATGVTNVWGVAVAATIGAIVGDSIGYSIGRRGGRTLLVAAGRRFPRHFGPDHLRRAEQIFDKWGVWAVFFGRFVAILRILAGPLAGALGVRYRQFLLANATGGVLWAFGTSLVVYYVGRVAETYLRGFAWVALGVAVAAGIVTTLFLRRRAARAAALRSDDDPSTNPSALDEIAAIAVEAAHDVTVMATHAEPPPGAPPPPPSSARAPTPRSPRAPTRFKRAPARWRS